MQFRREIHSNSAFRVFTAIVSVICMSVLSYYVATFPKEGDQTTIIVLGCALICFTIGFMYLLNGFVHPWCSEFIVDKESIRWGVIGKEEYYKVFPIKDISFVQFNEGDEETYPSINMKNGKRKFFPHSFVHQKNFRHELTMFLTLKIDEFEVRGVKVN